jgi:hypothetical protein
MSHGRVDSLPKGVVLMVFMSLYLTGVFPELLGKLFFCLIGFVL